MLLLGKIHSSPQRCCACAVCCQAILDNAAGACAVCLRLESVQLVAAQVQDNAWLTSAVNSKASSIPRQDMVRLAVMRWVLRFLDPAAANTPDPNSSNPNTCAQLQWCVRDVCVSNASFSIPASDRLLRCFEHVQSRCKSNKKSSMPDWHDEAES